MRRTLAESLPGSCRAAARACASRVYHGEGPPSMNKVVELASNWAVLTRSSGEVLTAEARSPGLHMGLLGAPSGFDCRDAEGWLYDVGAVAHESSEGGAASSRAIPVRLHTAPTGPLFSHAELWDQSGTPSPCSFAFADGPQEVGFGMVGKAEVNIWVDGEAVGTEGVPVRDAVGREARAWKLPSARAVRVRIVWRPSDADAAGAAEVEAIWGGTAPPVLEHPIAPRKATESTASAPGPQVPAPAIVLPTAPIEERAGGGTTGETSIEPATGSIPVPTVGSAAASPMDPVETAAGLGAL